MLAMAIVLFAVLLSYVVASSPYDGPTGNLSAGRRPLPVLCLLGRRDGLGEASLCLGGGLPPCQPTACRRFIGGGRVPRFHNSIPPSKQNRLGKPPEQCEASACKALALSCAPVQALRAALQSNEHEFAASLLAHTSNSVSRAHKNALSPRMRRANCAAAVPHCA